VVTDTPDFWRRPRQPYPEHAGRFSGEPAYFKHVAMATKQVLSLSEMSVEDIDYCVFHTPNAKFPTLIAKKLGFSPEQIAPSLVVRDIGNTYAAASLLALSAVLDQAPEDKTILVTSYGSGSGADSFIFKTTKALVEARKNWTESIAQQISKLKPVSYQKYLKNTQQTH
jgi:hydroxymethylglutaryl-CoA synthase